MKTNELYTAPLYLGGSLTKFDLIYDTTIPETSIAVTTCSNCSGVTKYDFAASGTFAWTGVTKALEFTDGSKVEGERCTEKVCAINSGTACINSYQMLCVKSVSNQTKAVSGRVGLERMGTMSDKTSCYMEQLFTANVISQKTFSLSFDAGNTSFLDFGPPVTGSMQAGATVTYIPVVGSETRWTNSVDGFYFSSNAQKWTTASKLAVIDSTQATLAGPKAEVEFFITYL